MNRGHKAQEEGKGHSIKVSLRGEKVRVVDVDKNRGLRRQLGEGTRRVRSPRRGPNKRPS